MKYFIFFIYLITTGYATAQVQGTALDEPRDIPEFTLTDNQSTSFTRQDLVDRWTLLMFGFNSCPDVCPFTLKNLEHAVAETSMRVSPDNVPKVVFISVDPERDRNTVTEYATFFHPDFRGVTGDREYIDLLVEATDAFYRLMPKDKTGYYDVQHSAFVSVISPDAEMIAKLEPPFHAGKTAEFLARLQIAYRRETGG